MKLIRFPFLLLLAAATLPAHAGYIFGLANQGGIYKIDTITGLSVLAVPTTFLPVRGATNGLARDSQGAFYYSFGQKFYRNINGTEQLLAVPGFAGSNDNATIYQNSYVFVSKPGEVSRINLTTLALTTQAIANLQNGFGDIASDTVGRVWTSSTTTQIQRFNLNNLGPGATTLPSHGPTVQLGFDASGGLFGINYDDSRVYSVNLVTGARTWTGAIVKNQAGSLLKINDAASDFTISGSPNGDPVPEPASLVALVVGLMAFLARRKV